jgi:hypothetical protein
MSIPLILSLLVLASAAPRNGLRELIVHVTEVPSAWAEPQLEAKLTTHFSRTGNLRVFEDENLGRDLPSFPIDYYNLDSLLAWGTEAGGDYLIVVNVASERLERYKTFSLPLVVHKYENVAVIEGEWRLVDLKKGRLLNAESFCVTLKGKQALQACMDDDIHAAALNLTPMQKVILFDRLEDKLAEQLVKKVSRYARGQ